MILPHFDYANIVWSSCDKGNLDKLQKLQNVAMRIILSVPFRTHVKDMLKALKFMDVRDRITYSTGCMVYKTLNSLAPKYLNSIQQVSSVHTIGTRANTSGDAFIPGSNINYGKNTFYYKGSVLWNCITKDIRKCNSFLDFKGKLKNDLKW